MTRSAPPRLLLTAATAILAALALGGASPARADVVIDMPPPPPDAGGTDRAGEGPSAVSDDVRATGRLALARYGGARELPRSVYVPSRRALGYPAGSWSVRWYGGYPGWAVGSNLYWTWGYAARGRSFTRSFHHPALSQLAD